MVLGCYLNRPIRPVLRKVQSAGSLAIMAGPFLLCASFFTEFYNPALLRPLCRLGIYLSFAGVLSHVAAAICFGARKKSLS